jgi:hypothetical protein
MLTERASDEENAIAGARPEDYVGCGMYTLLFATLALAAEPAAAPSPPVTTASVPVGDRDALVAAIADLQRRVATEVLVTAAGPEAEQVLVAAGDALPAGARRVVRVGILGEVEAEPRRALEELGMRCALRVGRAAGAEAWDLRLVGDCVPVPVVVPVAPPVAAPTDRAALEAKWREQALVRVNLGPRSDVPWTVRDGRGRTLTAVELARLTGDTATTQRLVAESHRGEQLALGFNTLGIVAGAGALGALVVVGGEEPDWADYAPSPTQFATRAAYDAAVAQEGERFQAELKDWEVAREDASWMSASLTGVALIAVAAAPLAREGAAARRREIAWHWTVEACDSRLAAYNDGLRARLGLPTMVEVRGDALPPPRAVDALRDAPDSDTPDSDMPDAPAAPSTPDEEAP